MSSTNDIRAAFLDFFAGHDHRLVPSSPLVPHNDPTLMFTNAGMVQFKNVFTGAETRDYARATSSQKCVRAGGKHNDLDNVGYTARHHTFFEMLGNFSFGDYFKEEAIKHAWDLLTGTFELSAARLLVTVYHDDEEAFDLWRRISGLPEERIIRIASSDNFWSMGDSGPCGPCSEIFYDHGPGLAGGPPGSADQDGDRFVEIWNLVFMQFDQQPGAGRLPLPRPSIDTGMGLERIAAVLQGTHDNYATDQFRRLIMASAEASGAPAEGAGAVSHRVIADHLRASAFLIADGVLPANEGRGYVLRRIMRRAMRHAHILGCEEPLMWRLVPALVDEMGGHYPELGRAEALIAETLKGEESRFQQTLARGLRLLEGALDDSPGDRPLPGAVAFKLYDTYGFPYDLTEDALRARGRTVERAGFDAAMARQRAEARRAWAGSGETATEKVWFDVRETAGATDFLGYETVRAEGKVVALVRAGAPLDCLKAGEEGAIITNQTPFYGESGGQTGDRGTLTGANGAVFTVTDTLKKLGDLHVHTGSLAGAALGLGDEVSMTVDDRRRQLLRAHHSATHLLHAALRHMLGDHVTQKGSLVAADRLRFDFSHSAPLSAPQLADIETGVNELIAANSPVSTRLMTPDEAIDEGAMALFGEKYGDEVRVVAMGSMADSPSPYSVELCGGTHVGRTGDIGLFRIVSESAVAAGVRRIEAMTGTPALSHIRQQEGYLRDAAAALRIPPPELAARIEALLAERKRLEREAAELRRQLAGGGASGDGGDSAIRTVAGVSLLARRVDGLPARELRGLIDDAKQRLGSGVAAIVAVNDGKAALAVGVTDDLCERISAIDLVRAGAAALGGKKGGGRPDMAQAGGPNGAAADQALSAIAKILEGA